MVCRLIAVVFVGDVIAVLVTRVTTDKPLLLLLVCLAYIRHISRIVVNFRLLLWWVNILLHKLGNQFLIFCLIF